MPNEMNGKPPSFAFGVNAPQTPPRRLPRRGGAPRRTPVRSRARVGRGGQRSFGDASRCVANRGNCGNCRVAGFGGFCLEIARKTYVFIRHDLVGGGGISLRSACAGHFEGRVRLLRADAPRDRLWLPPSGRSRLRASARFHVSVSRRVNLQTGAISSRSSRRPKTTASPFVVEKARGCVVDDAYTCHKTVVYLHFTRR